MQNAILDKRTAANLIRLSPLSNPALRHIQHVSDTAREAVPLLRDTNARRIRTLAGYPPHSVCPAAASVSVPVIILTIL